MNASANKPTPPKLMGVLNVTPDSFSDGGNFTNAQAALEHATSLIDAGASIIDIGGESTRPGSVRLSPQQEQERAIDIVAAVASLPQVQSGQVRISIDTLNSSTAALAVAAGATIINDVSGGAADSQIFRAAADTGATYVLGHWHNFEAGSAAVQVSDNIVADVLTQLGQSVGAAEAAGLARNQIVLDPGLGFGKSSAQNWQLVANIARLTELGLPLLIGASRKRFIAEKLAAEAGLTPADIDFAARDAATAELGAGLWSTLLDASLDEQLWGLRVHNVALSNAALQNLAAIRFAH